MFKKEIRNQLYIKFANIGVELVLGQFGVAWNVRQKPFVGIFVSLSFEYKHWKKKLTVSLSNMSRGIFQ